MSTYTENLNLFKYDTVVDAALPFNINNALNENWDKLDNFSKNALNKKQITNCILEAPNEVATYSGSTITAKAGLKVLIPNGKNADDSLKNIEYTLSADISVTIDSSRTGDLYIFLNNDNTLGYWSTNAVGYNEKTPVSGLYWKYFNSDVNYWKETLNGAAYTIQNCVIIAKVNVTSGNINLLTNYHPVDILKRNDKLEIMGWVIPDYNSVVTLSSSSFPYTAPSKGIVYLEIECRGSHVTYLVNGQVIFSENAPDLYYARSSWTIVDAGDVLACINATNFRQARFYPLKGV